MFARTEGIVPAPESNHAVRAAIDEAIKAREEGKPTNILFNLSGHGHFDMQAYTDYFAGKLWTWTTTRRRWRPRYPICRKWRPSEGLRPLSRKRERAGVRARPSPRGAGGSSGLLDRVAAFVMTRSGKDC